MFEKKNFLKNYFVLVTCTLSLLLSILFSLKGFRDGWSIYSLVVIGFNLLYIPFALLFKKQCFSYYHLIYGFVLVFINGWTQTCLYNNYTALFVLFIVIMTNKKLELPAYILYSLGVCIVFLFNDEGILYFLIHVLRSCWFIFIMNYVFDQRFERKKLVLYEDEERILEQLANGKMYQKEVEGFSENTVYRKLKAARERNGNITKDELVEAYRQSKQ